MVTGVLERVTPNNFTFCDLFSGCGGLSLGLSLAGFQGVFAIEKDSMAFETFSANFLSCSPNRILSFKWPNWLEKKPWDVGELIRTHSWNLKSQVGELSVLAGGPPCQGFSFAGRRNESDPRNHLFERYVEVVELMRPKVLLMENVPGMAVAHSSKGDRLTVGSSAKESFYQRLYSRLSQIGYDVSARLMDASRFGVPQRRTRLIVIGLRADIAAVCCGGSSKVFDMVEEQRLIQVQDLGLQSTVSIEEAICDLETDNGRMCNCVDPASPKGFSELCYDTPKTRYQRLMHGLMGREGMDSMRLARHCRDVRMRYGKILIECPKGERLPDRFRMQYGLKKHRIYPMNPTEPAPTITTLPDDLLHYSEPRILTVRESARVQSFPDWFVFRGKFTTGGQRRKMECPRYTQVGNAVPPLLARALGKGIEVVLRNAGLNMGIMKSSA